MLSFPRYLAHTETLHAVLTRICYDRGLGDVASTVQQVSHQLKSWQASNLENKPFPVLVIDMTLSPTAGTFIGSY